MRDIVFYVFGMAGIIACAAGVASTGRVTLPLLVSLAIGWMFVPLTQVAIAALLVATAPGPGAAGRVALLLRGHAPWSLFLLVSAVAIAGGGYLAYRLMVILAIVPLLLTLRIVHAFSIEVLKTTGRGALARALAHQAVTWLVAAVYLDRAVSLVPRVLGWLL